MGGAGRTAESGHITPAIVAAPTLTDHSRLNVVIG